MTHFAGEIVLLSLVVAILWFCIGWWWCNLDRAKSHQSREAQWTHRLNTLRRDRDAFRDEVEKAHGTIRVLENRRADGKSPPKEAELTTAERNNFQQTIKDLREAHTITERKMLGFSQHIESLQEQNLEREDILQQLKKKLEESTRALKARELRLDQFAADTNDQADNVTVATMTKLKEALIQRDKTILQMRASQKPATATASNNPKLEHTINLQNDEIKQLHTHIEQLRKNLADTTHTLQERELRLEEINSNSSHQALESQSAQEPLQKIIRTHETTIASLHADQQEQDQLKLQNLQLKQSQEEQEQKFAHAQKQLLENQHTYANALARNRQEDSAQITLLKDQVGNMREAMSEQEQVISQLRHVLDKASKLPATATPRTLHKPTNTDTPRSGDLFERASAESTRQQSTQAPEHSSAQPEPGPSIRLYTTAPDQPNDLKVIRGIGPAFERTLNSLGIYRFEQIAAFTDDDIHWIARELQSFPERITRGRWVEQAKQFVS